MPTFLSFHVTFLSHLPSVYFLNATLWRLCTHFVLLIFKILYCWKFYILHVSSFSPIDLSQHRPSPPYCLIFLSPILLCSFCPHYFYEKNYTRFSKTLKSDKNVSVVLFTWPRIYCSSTSPTKIIIMFPDLHTSDFSLTFYLLYSIISFSFSVMVASICLGNRGIHYSFTNSVNNNQIPSKSLLLVCLDASSLLFVPFFIHTFCKYASH